MSARRELALKLIEDGMSQRQAAKILGYRLPTFAFKKRITAAPHGVRLRTPRRDATMKPAQTHHRREASSGRSPAAYAMGQSPRKW
jgi:hypothetical protein